MTREQLNHNLCEMMEKYFLACKSNSAYVGEEKYQKYNHLIAELWENWYLGSDYKSSWEEEIPHSIELLNAYSIIDILTIFAELGLEVTNYKRNCGGTFVKFKESSHS